MKSAMIPLEWAIAATGMAVAATALALPLALAAPLRHGPGVVAEMALAAPLALWLAAQAARSLHESRWPVLGGAVTRTGQPVAYWAFFAIFIVSSGAFFAGFVRAVLSVVAGA